MKNLNSFLNYLLTISAVLCCEHATAQTYCTTGLYGYACSVGDYVNGVTTSGGTTNISNTGSGCTAGGYIYHSGAGKTLTVTIGTQFTLTVNNTPSYPEYYGIWIDYNRDGDFVDAGEQIFAGTSSTASNATVAVSNPVTVPATAVAGSTRLRVRCVYGYTNPSSCGYYPGGECEDYAVVLNPACSTPNVTSHPQSANKCSGDNVNFSVGTTPGSTSTWQWQVNSGSGYTNITDGGNYSGSSTSTLTISAIPASFNTNSYRALMYGTCTTAVYSNAATITLLDAFKLISQSSTDTICENAPITLGVLTMGSGLAFQWQVSQGTGYADILNIPPFSSSNTDTLNIAYAPDTLNGRTFRVKITSGSGCVSPPQFTPDIYLGVRALPATVPVNPTVKEGAGITFTLSPAGSPSWLYQWQEDKNDGKGFRDINDGNTYSGTLTGSMTIDKTDIRQNNYKYRCMISGMCDGVVFSDYTVLMVNKAVSIATMTGKDGIRIYPTPATTRIYVDAPSGSTAAISNIEGKSILKAAITKEGLDLNAMADGVYTIRVSDEKGNLIKTDNFTKTNR